MRAVIPVSAFLHNMSISLTGPVDDGKSTGDYPGNGTPHPIGQSCILHDAW